MLLYKFLSLYANCVSDKSYSKQPSERLFYNHRFTFTPRKSPPSTGISISFFCNHFSIPVYVPLSMVGLAVGDDIDSAR